MRRAELMTVESFLTVLIRVQRRLSCGLEDHLIERAESRFLSGAIEPLFRDATAQGLQLLAARLRVFFHPMPTTHSVLAKP